MCWRKQFERVKQVVTDFLKSSKLGKCVKTKLKVHSTVTLIMEYHSKGLNYIMVTREDGGTITLTKDDDALIVNYLFNHTVEYDKRAIKRIINGFVGCNDFKYVVKKRYIPVV